MTKTKAREWLKAVRKLQQLYKGGDASPSCPLCEVVVSRCRGNCLWLIFARTHCSDHMSKYDYGSPGWIKLSLARLARWEKRLQKIIVGSGAVE